MRSKFLQQKFFKLSAGIISICAAAFYLTNTLPIQPSDFAAEASQTNTATGSTSSDLGADASLGTSDEDLSSNSSDDPQSERTITGKVYHCNDGDTCRVQVGNAMWMNVRLAGIDAPEVAKGRGRQKHGGQPYGDTAKAYINERLQQQIVTIRQVDLDPFNRPVVEITLDKEKRSINLELLATGHAEMYRGKTKRLDRELYAQTETEAKQRKLGIWGLADYQSPAIYRKQQKK